MKECSDLRETYLRQEIRECRSIYTNQSSQTFQLHRQTKPSFLLKTVEMGFLLCEIQETCALQLLGDLNSSPLAYKLVPKASQETLEQQPRNQDSVANPVLPHLQVGELLDTLALSSKEIEVNKIYHGNLQRLLLGDRKIGHCTREHVADCKIVLIKINIAAIGASIVMYEDHPSGQEPLMVKT